MPLSEMPQVVTRILQSDDIQGGEREVVVGQWGWVLSSNIKQPAM